MATEADFQFGANVKTGGRKGGKGGGKGGGS